MTRDNPIQQIYHITLIVLFTSSFCLSQTYLEPSLEISYSKNAVLDEDNYFFNQIQSDEEFKNSGLCFGLNLWQKVFDRMELGILTNYQRNYLRYSDRGVVGFTDRRHERFTLTVMPRCIFFDNIEIGMGPSFHHLFRTSLGKKYSDIWTETSSGLGQFQLGLRGLLSYRLKSVKLNFSYSFNRSINQLEDGKISNTKIITFGLGYIF